MFDNIFFVHSPTHETNNSMENRSSLPFTFLKLNNFNPWFIIVKGRLSGSLAQLAECSKGKREAPRSSPGRAKIFSSPVTFCGSVWVRG